jgi:hypothetical protein
MMFVTGAGFSLAVAIRVMRGDLDEFPLGFVAFMITFIVCGVVTAFLVGAITPDTRTPERRASDAEAARISSLIQARDGAVRRMQEEIRANDAADAQFWNERALEYNQSIQRILAEQSRRNVEAPKQKSD